MTARQREPVSVFRIFRNSVAAFHLLRSHPYTVVFGLYKSLSPSALHTSFYPLVCLPPLCRACQCLVSTSTVAYTQAAVPHFRASRTANSRCSYILSVVTAPLPYISLQCTNFVSSLALPSSATATALTSHASYQLFPSGRCNGSSEGASAQARLGTAGRLTYPLQDSLPKGIPPIAGWTTMI